MSRWSSMASVALSRSTPVPLPARPSAAEEKMPSLRGNIVAGTLAIVLGFGGFFVWGYTVHLDSAAVATGSVIADTKRKTVSHLEGGILDALLVNEGDVVVAGQPLLRLEDTRAASALRQLEAQRVGLLARLARLNAEQEVADAIQFPAELTGSDDAYMQEILRNEALLFERRRETLERTIDVQQKQIDAYTSDITAANAQIDANADQQQLMRTQIAAIEGLVEKGLATRAELSELQGRLSELLSEAGGFSGNRARAEEGRAAAELEISKARTAWQSDVADLMQSTQIELSGLNDEIAAAADVLRRVVITAPEEGIVTNIQVRTKGGVVPAGAPIMDIVPEDTARIIEARIDPRDIDSVRVGAEVRVRLPAYGSRQTVPLTGTLTYVAADQTVDERTSYAFYVVRASVSEQALAEAPQIQLYPGEPADLLILNRPRLAIDYILAPIADSQYRAFHEE
jgi:HlyD family secretion protein